MQSHPIENILVLEHMLNFSMQLLGLTLLLLSMALPNYFHCQDCKIVVKVNR